MKKDHRTNAVTWYSYDGSGALAALFEQQGAGAVQLKEQPVYGSDRLGTFYRLGSNYQYTITDHVGNTRVVINRNKTADNAADIVYYADYYPLGMEVRSGGIENRYGYQGLYAEKDKETGWNNFELRNYDAAIGRWLTTDPYGQYHSPYVGMGNNPVNRIDKNGGLDGEFEMDKNGNWIKTSTKGDDIGVDFYHTDLGLSQITHVTDNKGNWNIINNGRQMLSGEQRGQDVNWYTIYNEWFNGTGPEYSYFEGNHPSNLSIKKDRLYQNALKKFNLSGESKKGIAVNFKPILDNGPGPDGYNMQIQMMGSFNVSFYKLGPKTLSLIHDSKSRTSFYLHLPVKNYKRTTKFLDDYNIKHNIFTEKESNTYQTYLFYSK